MRHDAPWEGDGCDLYTVFADNGLYRMYYLAWDMGGLKNGNNGKIDYFAVCYAESTDGIVWTKPNLGITEYDGSKNNNILLITGHPGEFYNFFVFKDTCPHCPADERYKGLYLHKERRGTEIISTLRCVVSADGLRFRNGWDLLTDPDCFDTNSCAFWNTNRNEYVCFIRGLHDQPPGSMDPEQIRDLRITVSPDFRAWSTPVPLDFDGGEDIQLYTSAVSPYSRAPHMFVGFPSRYVRRSAWTPNFQRLCGVEARKDRMKNHPRFGLTTTDCLFMCSRDGYRWKRYDEAFLRPGPEQPKNWVYGDCYPAAGLIETPGALPGEDRELSIYEYRNHWSGGVVDLWRYTLRVDGFVSRHAGATPAAIITKPFVFTGSVLTVNFSTSAAGYVYLSVLDENCAPLPGYESGELFGDSIDRIVDFDLDLGLLAGRAVRLGFTLRDADVYSFRFKKE